MARSQETGTDTNEASRFRRVGQRGDAQIVVAGINKASGHGHSRSYRERRVGQTVVVAWHGWQRFGAVDVHYPDAGGACAGLLVAADERFTDVVEQRTAWLPVIEAYQPGRFYLRELPAITAVLATTSSLDLLVIDGYVDLDPQGSPGLGGHIHAQTGLPIIGVAKTAFRTATHAVAIRRGSGATRPLFITTAGLRVDQAAALVAAMAGPHRIPDALRRVDTLARQGSRSWTSHGGQPADSADENRPMADQPHDPGPT